MEPWERGEEVLRRGRHACRMFLFEIGRKDGGSSTGIGELALCGQWCRKCAVVVCHPTDPLRAGVGERLGALE